MQVRNKVQANLAARIKLHIQQSPPVIYGGIVVAAFVVWLFWGRADAVLLSLWFLAVAAFGLIRIFGFFPYLHPNYSGNTAVPTFDRVVLLGSSLVSGVLWGFPAALLINPSDFAQMAEVVVILCGVAAGAIAPLALWTTMYVMFAVPVLAPVAVVCMVIGNGFAATTGALLMVFLGTCLVSARTYERMVAEAVNFKFANADLVKELTHANAALRKMSYVDELTDIENRRGFSRSYYSMAVRTVRWQRHFSLLIIDADYFKQYNDAHGHDAGDDALVAIAGVLQTQCDHEWQKPARIGGEEFAIVVMGMQPPELRQFAETIRQQIEALPVGDGMLPQRITVSIGGSTMVPLENTTPDIDGLFKCADQALYKAKELGRNRVVLDGFMQALPENCRSRFKAPTEEFI